MMTRIHATSVLLLFLSAMPLSRVRGDDWPQFRGPSGQGVSDAKGLPQEWGPAKNVAWKTEIPGRGWSSPVKVGKQIFLTTSVSAPNGSASLYAVCINADTGKPAWDTEVFRPDSGIAHQLHPKNTPASATPLVAGDRLYVHFGAMGTAALDLNGKVIWRQTDIKYSPVHGTGGSPVLVDGLLIFSCDGMADPFVVALDAATGKIKWKTPRNISVRKTFSFATALAIEVGGKTQVVLPGSGLVAAYDPQTGKEIWRVRYGDGYSVVPRPVYSHGLLFLSSGFDSAVLYAIRPEGAAGDVTNTHVAWTIRKAAPLTPSVVVDGDEIYFVSDNGIATCADAATGKTYWTHRLDGNFSASPVLADGKIYFQSETGSSFVVKSDKQFQLLAQNDMGEPSLASYAIADDSLFIRTEKHLWRIGTARASR